MIRLIILLCATSLITSCASFKTTTTKTTDIYGSGVIQHPVIVDMDVKETKVTGTASSKSKKAVENVKNEAVNNALKTASADVLVEPKFEIITKGSSINVTVTGFPATYKNFRQMKTEDVPLLKAGAKTQAKIHTEEPKEKKGKRIATTISLTVVGLVAAIIALSGSI